MTVSLHRDSFKISTNANNAGIGNKLVTIFAHNHDNFSMTINLSLICQFFSGSGQILHHGHLYRSPGLAKIAAPVPIPRDGGLPAGTAFWLKYQDSNRRASSPTLSAYTRWPLGVMPENPDHMIISSSFLVNLQYET